MSLVIMMKKCLMVFFFVALLCFCASCNKYSKSVEEVLSLAGENRDELEKVLLHYQDDDSKLKAAEFLIQNMVGHSMPTLASVETYKSFYQRCDSIRDEYKSTNRSQWIALIDSLWDVFQAGKTSAAVDYAPLQKVDNC